MSDDSAKEISNQDLYKQVVLMRQEQTFLKKKLTDLKAETDNLRRTTSAIHSELGPMDQMRGRIRFIFWFVVVQVALIVLDFLLF